MKKLLLIVTIFTSLHLSGFAQDDGGDQKERGGKIEALKIAYLTKKMNLSPEEAQRFWPVYNRYAEEMKTARMSQRQKKYSELQAEDTMLSIRKKYNTEFSKVLAPQKVNGFFSAEREFAETIRKELKERREMRQQMMMDKQKKYKQN